MIWLASIAVLTELWAIAGIERLERAIPSNRIPNEMRPKRQCIRDNISSCFRYEVEQIILFLRFYSMRILPEKSLRLKSSKSLRNNFMKTSIFIQNECCKIKTFAGIQCGVIWAKNFFLSEVSTLFAEN